MKKTFILCMILAAAAVLQASPVRNLPVCHIQPSGDTLRCLVSGDEIFHRLHDADGYTIIQHPQTGWYVYARLDKGLLVPTDLVAGIADPAAAGLEPDLMPGREYMMQRYKMWEGRDKRLASASASKSGNRNHGTLNNIVIFIRFSDEEICSRHPLSYIDSMYNDTTDEAISLASYFWSSSYNKLRIVTHFFPAQSGGSILSYQDSMPRSYYRPYNAAINPQGYANDNEREFREKHLLERAVNWINANSPVPQELDIDMDNDGYIDNISFIASGSTDGWNDLFWPHMWDFDGYDHPVTINGKQVYLFNFLLGDASSYDLSAATLCHEMTHTLGAPDLYHYYHYTGVLPAGYWDLMEMHDGTRPQQTNSLFKYKYLNFIDSIPTISDSGRYTLQSLGSGDNHALRINSPDPQQWYILEFRDYEDRYDYNIPNRGLLVWRYNDDSRADNMMFDVDTPHELWLFRPGSSTDFVNGSVPGAAFGSNGRNAFNTTTSPHPYLCDGTIDTTFSLSDIAISDDGHSISFTFTPQGLPLPGCGALEQFPYEQSFETATLDCWDFVSENPENDLAAGNLSANIMLGNARKGAYALRFSSRTRAANNDYRQRLVSPEINYNDSLRMGFYCRLMYDSIATFSLRYSTTTNDTAAFSHTLWSSSELTRSYTEHRVTLPPDAKYVAFFYNSNHRQLLFLDGITMRPVCEPEGDYPMVQDFESMDLGCWQFVSGNAENDMGRSGDCAGFNSANPHTGDYCFRFSTYESTSADYNQYLITPRLLHYDTLHMEFYYKEYDSGDNEKFCVRYSTTTDDPAAFTDTLWIGTDITDSYQRASVTIPTGARYVAFNCYSYYNNFVYLDDIVISAGPNAIVQASSSQLGLYPNPAQSRLYLEEQPAGTPVRIFDMKGAEVFNGAYDGNGLDVSQLPAGIYLVATPAAKAKFCKQ